MTDPDEPLIETGGLDELLSGLPLPAFVVGFDERVIALNLAAQGLLGAGSEGRKLALLSRSPDLLAAVGEILGGGAARETILRMSDDSSWRAQISPLHLGETASKGVRALCVLRDTTSEQQTEAIRRDFVANVSHELRTPLTAMMGFIETLRTRARDDAKARDRFLEIMEGEAGRMNRLVRDLLHLSRVESEERMRPRETVDLAAVIRGTAANLRPVAEERESEIDLVGLNEALPLKGDGDQLTQVFLNLIENALKYGGRGRKVTVTLSQTRSSKGPMARVDVKDQGEGIEGSHLPRLTERFYRVDTHRSRAEGGTGLGLAIVKHIINRHRGQLKIESKIGQGSTFSVLLPLS